MDKKLLTPHGAATDVARFVAEARAVQRRTGADPTAARLIMAIDATQSREASWDLAQGLQAKMFEAAGAHAGLFVQLVYFRGIDECRASRWHDRAAPLVRAMAGVRCAAGHTQIGRVLRHALAQRREGPVAALALIGDACEEEPDEILGEAGRLAAHGVPVFAFLEGRDEGAAAIYQKLASLTGGAFHRFDTRSPASLLALLRAVAAFSAGGREALGALARDEGGPARLLLAQLGR